MLFMMYFFESEKYYPKLSEEKLLIMLRQYDTGYELYKKSRKLKVDNGFENDDVRIMRIK